MGILKSSYMSSYTLYEWRYVAKADIVPALEDADHSSLTILVGDFLKVLRQPFIIKLVDSCVLIAVYMVILMSIKAC